MTALIPFCFEGRKVRVLDRSGQPWFVLVDLCEVLEIGNPRQVASRLPSGEKDGVTISDAIGREQVTTIVNESAMYRLTFRSRKPAAERFTTEVTSVILPTIRRTGSYGGVSEERVVELIGMALRPLVAELIARLAPRTTLAGVVADGLMMPEIIAGLRLPPTVSRRRAAARLVTILRHRLAEMGIPGPVKVAGVPLRYPRSEAMAIAIEHRELLTSACSAPRDGRQLTLLPGGA